jgi:hypothetical protein
VETGISSSPSKHSHQFLLSEGAWSKASTFEVAPVALLSEAQGAVSDFTWQSYLLCQNVTSPFGVGSVIDTVLLTAKVYTSKLSFCAQFMDVVNVTSYAGFKTHDLHFGMKHSKRWFFSYSLSQMTGLAESSVVKTLSEDTHKVVEREQQDAAEILKLEKQSNDILLGQKEQNDRVARLYSDKNKLNENLKNVISDE